MAVKARPIRPMYPRFPDFRNGAPNGPCDRQPAPLFGSGQHCRTQVDTNDFGCRWIKLEISASADTDVQEPTRETFEQERSDLPVTTIFKWQVEQIIEGRYAFVAFKIGQFISSRFRATCSYRHVRAYQRRLGSKGEKRLADANRRPAMVARIAALRCPLWVISGQTVPGLKSSFVRFDLKAGAVGLSAECQ